MLFLPSKCGPDSGACFSTTMSHRVGIQATLNPRWYVKLLCVNISISLNELPRRFLFILFRFFVFFFSPNSGLLFSSGTNMWNSQGQICSLFHLIFVSYFLVCDSTTCGDFEMKHLLKTVRLNFYTIHISLTCQSRSYYFETDPCRQELSFARVFKVLVITNTGVRKLIWQPGMLMN